MLACLDKMIIVRFINIYKYCIEFLVLCNTSLYCNVFAILILGINHRKGMKSKIQKQKQLQQKFNEKREGGEKYKIC